MDDDDRRIPAHNAVEVARIYQVHARWLFGYACLRAGGDPELGADLVQDTFEAVTLEWETVRELALALHETADALETPRLIQAALARATPAAPADAQVTATMVSGRGPRF